MNWWTGSPLWLRVMIGLVVGGVVGYALRLSGQTELVGTFIKPIGDAFVALVRMLIAPLIFATVAAGMIAIGDPRRLGAIGLQTIGLYMATTLVAVFIGIGAGAIVRPGIGVQYEGASESAVAAIEGRLEAAGEAGGVAERLLAIIPANPIDALAKGDVLAIIFFAILVGMGTLFAGARGEAFGKTLESGSEVMIKVTEMVMQVAPFGVAALMAWVLADQGLGVLQNLALLALALYGACLLHMLVVYSGLVAVLGRMSPVRFFRGILDAQAVAFSTSSSNATLPVTIKAVTDNLKVSKTVAGSVLPLGATINMDGTAAYLGIVALFASQALGIPLDFADYFMIAFTATLASIGTAGIPSASLFLAATVLSTFGVTPEQAILVVAFIFPFDRLLDMMRTVTNVTGDTAVAVVVDRWQGGGDARAEP